MISNFDEYPSLQPTKGDLLKEELIEAAPWIVLFVAVVLAVFAALYWIGSTYQDDAAKKTEPVKAHYVRTRLA